MDYDMFDIEQELNKIKLEFNKKSNKIAELVKSNLRTKKITEDYSYRIDRDTFTKCINSITAINKWMDDCCDLGINLDNNDIVVEIQTCLVDLLCKCCNDDSDNIPAICYFLYDLQGGECWNSDAFWYNGEEVDLSSVDKLWEYLYNHPMKGEKIDD